MTNRSTIITHKNKQIYIHDYSNMNNLDNVYCDAIGRFSKQLAQAEAKDALLLIDATNTYVDKVIVDAYKAAAVVVKPHCEKIAVIGVSGVQRFFLNMINTFSKVGATAFDTKEEALDWLVK